MHKAIDKFREKMIVYESKEVTHKEDVVITQKKAEHDLVVLRQDLEKERNLKLKAVEKRTETEKVCSDLKAQLD